MQTIESLASQHYENFPVASWLLPRAYRSAVALIYAFARTADDIADEGDASPAERLAQLEHLEQQLHKSLQGIPTQPWLDKLAAVIHQHALPLKYFERLLLAFKQDADFKGYASLHALLDYCRYSAHPIGALLLHLFTTPTKEQLHSSNALCAALQLINFLQDLEKDSARHRCTLPLDSIKAEDKDSIARAVATELKLIRQLLEEAKPLVSSLTGGFGLQIRFTLAAAYRMLHKLEKRNHVFERPTLHPMEYVLLLPSVLMNAFPSQNTASC